MEKVAVFALMTELCSFPAFHSLNHITETTGIQRTSTGHQVDINRTTFNRQEIFYG